jgi:hypothetical protein
MLAKAYYPYIRNQRPAPHARALGGAAASIPNPALSMSLRSGSGPKCARAPGARAAKLLYVPVRWATENGGCRQKAQLYALFPH